MANSIAETPAKESELKTTTNMKSQLFKTIEYAYPTSTSACKGGFGKTGCYVYYEVTEALSLKRKNVKYFATKHEAETHAEKQAIPFTWLYLQYNPLLVQSN